MRSPPLHYKRSNRRRSDGDCYEQSQSRKSKNDDRSTTNSNSQAVTSSIPSLSSFAAPSWNNGATGDYNRKVRVVVRIRPIKNNEDTVAVSAVPNKDDGGSESDDIHMTTDQILNSPPSVRVSHVSEGVADIAARFNTNVSSPIAPHLPSIVTTPSRYTSHTYSSPCSTTSSRQSRLSTPVHKNVDAQTRPKNTNKIVSSSPERQSFTHTPTRPHRSAKKRFDFSHSKRATQQTILAGIEDPKQFDFDAVSNIFYITSPDALIFFL